MESREKQLIEARRKKLDAFRQAQVNPYPATFHPTVTAEQVHENFDAWLAEEQVLTIAGRVRAVRDMGKASFAHIEDETRALQWYVKRDTVGDISYQLWKQVDAGDWVGATGILMSTRTGEKTLAVKEWVLLAKCVRPLPAVKEKRDEAGNVVESYYEFTDQEARYRRRYVDLAMNRQVRDVFVKRAKIISACRSFLDSRGFIEVETPVLQPLYGGALARPFTTYHNELKQKLYLRIADELYLKRLIVGGMPRVYEISKDFRNEGVDRFHSPEFTMLEYYWAFADYYDSCDLIEKMVESVAMAVNGTTRVPFGDSEIDLKGPWQRKKFFELLQEETGKDLKHADETTLAAIMKEHKLEVPPLAGVGKLLDELFGELVEPKLIQPTFVMDYPLSLSPLARKHRDDPELVERFEVIVGGKELANSFSELNDPADQRERFEGQRKNRARGEAETQPMDEDYLFALECGMPPTAGLGMGIDRLCMWLLNQPTLRDVVLFPALRPEEHEVECRSLQIEYALRLDAARLQQLADGEYDIEDSESGVFTANLRIGEKLARRGLSPVGEEPPGMAADAVQKMFRNLTPGTRIALLLWERNASADAVKELRLLEFVTQSQESYRFSQLELDSEQSDALAEELDRRDLRVCNHLGYGSADSEM